MKITMISRRVSMHRHTDGVQTIKSNIKRLVLFHKMYNTFLRKLAWIKLWERSGLFDTYHHTSTWVISHHEYPYYALISSPCNHRTLFNVSNGDKGQFWTEHDTWSDLFIYLSLYVVVFPTYTSMPIWFMSIPYQIRACMTEYIKVKLDPLSFSRKRFVDKSNLSLEATFVFFQLLFSN